MKYTRNGNVLMVDAGSDLRADLLAHLFASWPADGEVASHDLGDVTAFNAARAALVAQRDQIQEKINSLDPATDPDPTLAAQLAALVAAREDINRVLRASQRPE